MGLQFVLYSAPEKEVCCFHNDLLEQFNCGGVPASWRNAVHGFRSRKYRWLEVAGSTVASQRPLLFTGNGSKRFQLAGARPVLDSRTNPETENGQETVSALLARSMVSRGLGEQEVFSHTVAGKP